MKITFKGLILAMGNVIRTPEEQHRAIIFYQLDKIYSTCKHIAKKWGVKTVPLLILKETLNQSKPSINTGNDFTDKVNMAHNNSLDSLYKGADIIARRMNSKSITLSEIKKGLDIIRKAYK